MKNRGIDPSKDFRSAPLWIWNTNVTTADINWMLKELKEGSMMKILIMAYHYAGLNGNE